MKIRSLLLGSVAAAGLSTGGAYAADLGVLTSLDICDSLGLSGLTISSDTNCLQITGEVKYAFSWGDYSGDSGVYIDTEAGTWDADAEDGAPDWDSRFDAWIKFVATQNLTLVRPRPSSRSSAPIRRPTTALRTARLRFRARSPSLVVLSLKV